MLCQLKSGREPTGRITGDNFYDHMLQLVDMSDVFWPYRELALHFVLEAGKYIIVPCTYHPDGEASFFLRIFSEIPTTAEYVFSFAW